MKVDTIRFNNGSEAVFGSVAQDALNAALFSARHRLHHRELFSVHILLGALERTKEEPTLAVARFLAGDVDKADVDAMLERRYALLLDALLGLDEYRPEVIYMEPTLSPSVYRTLGAAQELANRRSSSRPAIIGLGDLITAVFKSDEPLVRDMLEYIGINRSDALALLPVTSLGTQPIPVVAP